MRSRVAARTALVRCSTDEGSALAISLVFLMVFGLVIGATLQFAVTGQRTDLSIRAEAINTYAGGGALDGAVNRLRSSTSVGTQSDGTSACFTLPANQLDNTVDVTVTCTPRTGSGVSSGGSTASTPGEAIRTVGGVAADGLALSAAANIAVQGSVSANQAITVPSGSVLTSTGTIKAATCPSGSVGTVTPTCVAQASAADPAWGSPASYPPVVDLGTVACASPLMTLSPGTYLSKAELQAVFNCTNTVVWFKPGLYYFDFRDGGPAAVELVADTGDVVVGGAAQGWTPGTTVPGSVPFPTAALPGATACDPAAAGVNFVFGDESRLNVKAGKVQLCALNTNATAQHLVMQGLSADANYVGTTGTATATASVAGAGNTPWTGPAKGAVVDADPATARPKKDDTASLTVGPFTDLVPPDATAITATLTVTESLSKSAISKATLIYGSGPGTEPALTLRDCGVNACGMAFVPGATDVVTWTGKTPAQLNGASVNIGFSNPGGTADVWLDGAVLTVTYTAKMRKSSTTSKVLTSSGTAATTTLALHGTVYIPASAVDLGVTTVPYVVVDRGIVALQLNLAMTRAAGYVGPLISIPATALTPRQVLLVASSGGSELARAEVTLHDAGGTGNGSLADLTGWFVR